MRYKPEVSLLKLRGFAMRPERQRREGLWNGESLVATVARPWDIMNKDGRFAHSLARVATKSLTALPFRAELVLTTITQGDASRLLPLHFALG